MAADNLDTPVELHMLDWRRHPTGVGLHGLVFYPNGYGASVVSTPYTYGGDRGLFEVAVLRGTRKHFELTYDTPITNDVEGHLAVPAVVDLLAQIEALPHA